MAIGTLGTATANGGGTGSTTAIPKALKHPGSFITPSGVVTSFVQSDADVASINQAILDDQNFNQPAPGGNSMWGYSRNGVLYVPNRGLLRVLPGDVVAVDTFGWPILISARSIANSLWTTSAT